MRSSYRIAVLALAVAACAIAPASAAQQSADAQQLAALMKPITAVITAANTGNFKLLHAQYTASSTILDEFAPFEWTGANAQDRFFADFGKAVAELKMTETKLVAGPPKYSYAAGVHAYVVFPLTITAKIAGKPYSESGWLTMTLRQSGGAWKISAQSWAKGTENFNPY